MKLFTLLLFFSCAHFIASLATANPYQGMSPLMAKEMASRHKYLRLNPHNMLVDQNNNQLYYVDPHGKLQKQDVDVNNGDSPSGNTQDVSCRNERGEKVNPSKQLMATSGQLETSKSLGAGATGHEKCNSFKVADNQILTNAHCIESVMDGKRNCVGKQNAKECTKALKKKVGKKLSAKIKIKFNNKGKKSVVSCETINAVDRSLDYALLTCKNIPKRIPTAKLSNDKPNPKSKLTVATWDYDNINGQEEAKARVRQGKIKSTPQSPDDKSYQTTVKVKSGNSGSVVYNNKMEAVGLIHSRLGGGEGRNAHGDGVFTSTSAILKDIKKQSPRHSRLISSAGKGNNVTCKGDNSGSQSDPSSGEGSSTSE